MKVYGKVFLIILSLAFLGGCGGGVYVRSGEVTDVSSGYQTTDQQLIADSMVESLLQFPFPSNSVIRVDRIYNKTSEHISTKAITDLIVAKLQKRLGYRHIKFVVDYSELDRSDEAAIVEINRRISDKARERFLKDQTSPRYRIYGELTGIRSISQSMKDVSYMFSLKVEDFATGEYWTDVGQVRKVIKKPLFGY